MRVLVVGGGLAGLAAAEALVGRGHAVTLLEQRDRLGGRLAAAFDPHGDALEPSLPLLLTSHRATRALLAACGTDGRVTWGADLLRLLDPAAPRRGALRLPGALGAPGALAASLARLATLSLGDRVAAARVALAVRSPSRIAPAATDRETVPAWLARLGQSARARQALWSPLVAALLGDAETNASARAFAAALAELAGAAEPPRAADPGAPIEELLVGPLAERLRARAVIRLGVRVAAIDAERSPSVIAVRGVLLAGGERLAADAVVAAVSPWALATLVPAELRAGETWFEGLERLRPKTTRTVHLWTAASPPLPSRFAIAGSSPLWCAARPSSRGPHVAMTQTGDGGRLTVAAAEAALRGALPTLGPITDALLRDEEPAPALDAGADWDRPKSRSPIDGLFAAGAWVRTAIVPAGDGVEAALRSAESVAALVDQFEPPPPPAPPQGFVPLGSLRRRAPPSS